MNRITITIACAALLMVGAGSSLSGSAGATKGFTNIQLLFAIKNGNLDTIKKAIDQGTDINAKLYGNPMLYYAIRYENFKLADFLIENGAKITEDMIDQNNSKIMQFLADKGIKIKKKEESIKISLENAIKNNNLELVTSLIDKGADINQKTKFGQTLLEAAIEKNNHEIVEILVDNGANINQKTKFGRTLLEAAIEKNNHKIVEILVSNGADINQKNPDIQTLLETAIEKNNHKIVEILIAKGINLNYKDIYGRTLLENSVIYSASEIFKLLVQHGAEVNKYIIDITKGVPDFEDYLKYFANFLSEDKDIFTGEILRRFDNDSNQANKIAREEVFTLLSNRDLKLADRFYKTIHDIYQKNELEARGLDFVSKKYFYLELAKRAVFSPKRKDWVNILLPFCKGNIFTSKQGSFEFEVNEIINGLNPQDKLAVKKELEKKYGQKMFSAQQGKKLTDIGIKFQ